MDTTLGQQIFQSKLTLQGIYYCPQQDDAWRSLASGLYKMKDAMEKLEKAGIMLTGSNKGL